jgi:hypothetical protein
MSDCNLVVCSIVSHCNGVGLFEWSQAVEKVMISFFYFNTCLRTISHGVGVGVTR